MEKLEFKLAYDSVAIFEPPIGITNDKGEELMIYGLCYTKQERHLDDLFIFELNRWICYLQATSILLQKQGVSSPDFWELPNGNKITLQLQHKNLIYRIMRDRMIWYRLYETDVLDLKKGETDGDFLISRKPLERMGLVEKEIIDNRKEVENEIESE